MKKLFYGGTILTMEREGESVEALLIENGIITMSGDLHTLALHASDAEPINLGGKTLMPSFIDTHSHFTLTAWTGGMADLTSCACFQDIWDTLTQYLNQNPISAGTALFGFGYDPCVLAENKHPDKTLLNSISSDIPIIIFHISLHMMCVNDAALRAVPIFAHTPDPPGGVLGRTPDGAELSGYVEEAAMLQILSCFKQAQMADRQRLTETQALYARHGITTLQDGASGKEEISWLTTIAKEGLLKLDVVSYALMTQGVYKPSLSYNNHFRIGGYKLILDGSPQGRTAWLTEPYENSGDYRGYPLHTDEEVYTAVRQAIDDGIQILAHCNGDAAADQFIKQYSQAYSATLNSTKHTLRPVLIHGQILRDDQISQMRRVHIIPSFFVGHIFYWGDIHKENLGDARGNRISPLQSALRKGLPFTIHQDTPVTKPDMLHSVWCAVNRITKDGTIIGTDQRVSVYDALKAITINAAYAYHEEHLKGSLKAGKRADMVILDQNPLEVPPLTIKDIRVMETLKDGETVS